MKDTFIDAIHKRMKIEIQFDSKSKGIITRSCIPFDYGPSNKSYDKSDRYHFYDLNSPDGRHVLSILPEQLKAIKHIDDKFDPSEYVKWTPNWIIPRDWGIYS